MTRGVISPTPLEKPYSSMLGRKSPHMTWAQARRILDLAQERGRDTLVSSYRIH